MEWEHLDLTVLVPKEVSDAVLGATDCGYRLFDCAACYGNEDQIGQVFQKAFDERIVERKRFVCNVKSME